jgi:hypothetical protein
LIDQSLAHPAHPVPEPETSEERRLRTLEDRYRNELMDEQERLELRDRILKLRRKLETASETVDTHHSCLERSLPSSNF